MANIIDLVLKSKTSEASSGIDKLSKSMGSLKSSTLLATTNFIKLAKTISQLTDYTDEYTTSLRLLKTTLGNSTGEATKFIDKLSEMAGIDTATLNKQTARFVQLGESLSFSNEQAEKFSENLSVLSTKLAMLYNTDYETMGKALQKAVQGSQVTLKTKTGIAINDISLQSTLNANAIDREVSSLNDAEKAIVRYATILRQVTDDNNVYQDAVNSLAWQKQMLSYQFKKLATTIGQVFTPVMTQLYTVLNAVLMVITELIKMFAQLINVNLSLDSSVEDVSSGYDDLGTSIGKAANTAKKSLRGFDKLNNITTPTTGGGGNALGIDNSLLKLLGNIDESFLKIKNKATEIRDKIMEWLGFTKDLNGEWKWSSDTLFNNLAKAIKKVWEWYKKLNVVVKVFIGFALYKVISSIVTAGINLYTLISSKIIGAFKTLNILSELGGKNFIGMANAFIQTRTSAEKMSIAIAGITASISGIMMIVSAIQSMKEEGVNLNNVLTLIVGTLGLVGGAIVTVSVLMGELTVEVALATAGISLLLGGIAALITWFATQDTQVEKSTSFLQEYKEKLNEVKDAEQENTLKLESKIGRIRVLEKELKSLVDQNGKVVGSEEEVGSILSALNDLMGTEYEITNGQITLNGQKVKTYEALKKSIDEYCSSLRTEGYLEIKREQYNERLKQQLKLEEEINKTTKELTSSQEKYDMTSIEGVNQWLIDNKERINQLADLQSEYKTNAKYLDNYEKAAYLASIGSYDEAQKLLTDTVAKVGVSTETVINDLIKTSSRVPTIVQKSVNEITSQRPVVTVTVNADTSNFRRQVNSLAGMNVSVNANPVSLHAGGGFPTQGEMFIAREAGPELVGSINGHTAVANNDQIVKGIQSGVFSAMMSALNNTNFGGSNVTIEASGDTEGLLNFIEFKQKQKSRQFN